MFKIGDFAKLSRVSVKTLHYYEEVGLLTPVTIDRFTGYRYYSIAQLPRLNRILALKDLGFSLKQIGQLLDDTVTADQLRGMLKLRLTELQEEMLLAQKRFDQVAARLQIIEEEGKMADYEITLKAVEPLKIISAREVVPGPEQMRERCIALSNEVWAVLKQNGVKEAGPSLALYHESKDEGIDVEMALVLPATLTSITPSGRVTVYELPSVPTMASVIYQGSYDDFAAVGGVYAAMGKWIDSQGYRINGPSREIYLQSPKLGTNDPSGIMEIQFPVEKS